ncbi:MAG: hypothetical protein ABI658_24835 [Acidimicrobiales bacterium]
MRLADEAIDRALAEGDRQFAGSHGALFAILLAGAGETDAAVQRAEIAYALGAQLGNPLLIAFSNAALGYALSTQEPDRAIPYLEAAIAMADRVKGLMTGDIARRARASIRSARGEHAAAFELFTRSAPRSPSTLASR